MKRYGALLLIALLAGVVSTAVYFSACGTVNSNPDKYCADEFDCPSGYRCINNVCKQTSKSDAGHDDIGIANDGSESGDSGGTDSGNPGDGGKGDGGSKDTGNGDGGTGACGPSNCSGGCCDNKGVCKAGSDDLLCGNNGSECSDCKSKSELCISKQCSSLGDCSNGTCAGCCDDLGVCKQGTSSTACGADGKACDNCSVNSATCQSGHCQGAGTCIPMSFTCLLGCCDTYNVCHVKATDKACYSDSTPGAYCTDCTLSGNQCIGGVCKKPTCGKSTCADGCCDEFDSCSDGKFNTKCGTGGVKCVDCLSNGKLCNEDLKKCE